MLLWGSRRALLRVCSINGQLDGASALKCSQGDVFLGHLPSGGVWNGLFLAWPTGHLGFPLHIRYDVMGCNYFTDHQGSHADYKNAWVFKTYNRNLSVHVASACRGMDYVGVQIST